MNSYYRNVATCQHKEITNKQNTGFIKNFFLKLADHDDNNKTNKVGKQLHKTEILTYLHPLAMISNPSSR